jgi:hypothetical protein
MLNAGAEVPRERQTCREAGAQSPRAFYQQRRQPGYRKEDSRARHLIHSPTTNHQRTVEKKAPGCRYYPARAIYMMKGNRVRFPT